MPALDVNGVLETILRQLINDTSDTPTYSDERLIQLLAVASFQVISDCDFPINYVVDFNTNTITPDPVDSDPPDDFFVNLCTLKAACILDRGNYRTAVGGGIKISDSGSLIDTVSALKGFTDLMKNGNCAAYQSLLDRYTIANRATGECLLGPFSLAILYPVAFRDRARYF